MEIQEEKNNIVIKGARVNNLKDVSLEIPRGKFVVITGISGSGSLLSHSTPYMQRGSAVLRRVSLHTPASFSVV